MIIFCTYPTSRVLSQLVGGHIWTWRYTHKSRMWGGKRQQRICRDYFLRVSKCGHGGPNSFNDAEKEKECGAHQSTHHSRDSWPSHATDRDAHKVRLLGIAIKGSYLEKQVSIPKPACVCHSHEFQNFWQLQGKPPRGWGGSASEPGYSCDAPSLDAKQH